MLKIRTRLLLFVLGAVFIAFCETSPVSAQSSYYRSPTLNPWLGLGNRPTGVLDSYNQYVRPQMEMQREFQSQQDQINRQAVRQDMMYRDGQRARQSMQGGGPQIQRTGRASQAASFRNYSHYYPNKR